MKEIGRFWVPSFRPRWPTNKLAGGNKRKSAGLGPKPRSGYAIKIRSGFIGFSGVESALFRLFPSASLLVAHLGLNPVRVS